jgi:hypothetical protein
MKLNNYDYKKILWIEDLKEGVAAFCMLSKEHRHLWGYIDNKTNVIIEPRFSTQPSEFSEGLAIFVTPNGKGYIDKKGKVIINPCFVDCGLFFNGLAYVRKKNESLYGYINKRGVEVIKPEFNTASNFDGNFAVVTKNSGVYIIDKKGNLKTQELCGYYGV